MQQVWIIRLCGDKDERVNDIVSEFSKLVQKEYKSRHDWVGKVILLELCKKLDLTILQNALCANQNFSFKNEMLKVLWDFEL